MGRAALSAICRDGRGEPLFLDGYTARRIISQCPTLSLTVCMVSLQLVLHKLWVLCSNMPP